MSEKSISDLLKDISGDYNSGDYWTHYKGGVYEIIALAIQEDIIEPVIVYKSLKTGLIFTRPVKNWNENILIGESLVKRFNKGAP